MLENLEEGHVYLVEWNDGYKEISCTFKMSHKGFLIFINDNNTQIICRPSSIKTIKKLDT